MNLMFKKPLRQLNLQQFAEGEPVVPPAPPTPPPAPKTPTEPNGKVWTDEYVSGLRSEAALHRTAKKQYENHLRSIMGLKPDDEISEAAITTFQKESKRANDEALSKANARLISAEIKSLSGYDTKLVDRLLDRSKLTIGEDGAVTGLTEAVAALETEFPTIKTAATNNNGVNPLQTGSKTELQQLEEAYTAAKSNAERIAIKNKIHAIQIKQKQT